MAYSIIGILILTIIFLIIRIETLEGHIKGMKYTLDQIAGHLQMPEYPINDELRALLNEGKDVLAVKRARETLGLSLVEGKKHVDSLKAERK